LSGGAAAKKTAALLQHQRDIGDINARRRAFQNGWRTAPPLRSRAATVKR